jgi:orotate phosphoribosyltransferase
MDTNFTRWLAEQTIRRAAPGEEFGLASRRKSTYYLDLKPVLMHWRFLDEVGARMADHAVKRAYLLVTGMETAAIPLVTATVMAARLGRSRLHGFYVRKAIKDYGTKKRIEFADDLRGKPVLIVEDVVTSGGSSLEVTRLLREAGAIVDEVVAVVDRAEGGRELLASEGVTLTSFWTGPELLALL